MVVWAWPFIGVCDRGEDPHDDLREMLSGAYIKVLTTTRVCNATWLHALGSGVFALAVSSFVCMFLLPVASSSSCLLASCSYILHSCSCSRSCSSSCSFLLRRAPLQQPRVRGYQ